MSKLILIYVNEIGEDFIDWLIRLSSSSSMWDLACERE